MNFKSRQLFPREKSPRYPLNRGRDGPHGRSDVLQQEKKNLLFPRCPTRSPDTTPTLTVRGKPRIFTRHNDYLQWSRDRKVKRFTLLTAFIVFIRYTSFHDHSDPVPQCLQPYVHTPFCDTKVHRQCSYCRTKQ